MFNCSQLKRKQQFFFGIWYYYDATYKEKHIRIYILWHIHWNNTKEEFRITNKLYAHKVETIMFKQNKILANLEINGI